MNNLPKIKLPNLTKLTWEELTELDWELTESVYQQTKPIREEIWKRLQEEKKKKEGEQENLKKAS